MPLPATTDPTASRQMFELERALARLSQEQRQVILLVGLEGMSYEHTAGILRLPIGTVRSRLSRGRDALRKLLDMEERPSARSAAGGLMGVTVAEMASGVVPPPSGRVLLEIEICPAPCPAMAA